MSLVFQFAYHSDDSWLSQKLLALPMPVTYSPENSLDILRNRLSRNHL
jgi:hypothetical protein